MDCEYKLSDFNPIKWSPIEQMNIGDKGLVLSHENVIYEGVLIDNEPLRFYAFDDETFQRKDIGLMHISEFKNFSLLESKKVLH